MSKFSRFILLIPLAFAVATGCRSASKISKFTTTAPDTRARWTTAYLRARAGDANACAIFRDLAGEPEFPVKPLVELRAAEVCHDPNARVPRETLPNYLRDLGLDVALKLAQERGDKAGEMDAALEISRRKLPQVEKIKWTQLALQRATELGLAPKVSEINARLFEIAPRLNPAPAPKQFLAVAADYRLARDFTRARTFYERVIAGAFSFDDKVAALKGLRFAAKNARQDNDAHLKAARRLTTFLARQRASQSKVAKVRAAAYDARIYEARATWTEGHADEASKMYARLELDQRGRGSLAEVYFLRARMAEEKKDFAEVSRFLDLAVLEKPRDQMRDKILWYAAWNERQRGNPTAAITRFKDLEAATSDETVRARASYWLGTTLTDRGLKAEATDAFTRVVAVDPVGYYGLLAQRQLGHSLRLKRAAGARREIAATMDATLGDWLTALGETELLANLVDEAAVAYARSDAQTDEAWVDLLQTYGRAGLYLKLFSGLAALTPERRRSVLEAHPDLLFPRPWLAEVQAAATKSGIDEALIYAIMRQESAFDPKVRSFADAYGLMQLIPEVASRVAKVIGVPYARGEDMFDPAVSIPLGAAYLKTLSDRFDGQLILLSAAYNASDNAIRGWVKTRFKGDPLTFIEEIPYEETRTYVRLVMRNLIFYQMLKIEPASMPFPESVLRVSSVPERK